MPAVEPAGSAEDDGVSSSAAAELHWPDEVERQATAKDMLPVLDVKRLSNADG